MLLAGTLLFNPSARMPSSSLSATMSTFVYWGILVTFNALNIRAQMNRTMLPVMTGQYASGTSSYTVLQYAQGVKHSESVAKNQLKTFPTETFRGFDWGTKEKNIEHHGTAELPQYDLSKVNTKVTVHKN